MNGLVLLILSIAILVAGYIFYGRYLCKKWGVGENTDPTPECPGKLKLKETRVSTSAFIAWSPHKGRILQ